MEERLREENRAIFIEMLARLGRQDIEGAGEYLADDILAEWPFPPVPEMPEALTGKVALLNVFEGMKGFEPYRYEVTKIYEMADPQELIAEYRSNSRVLETGRPYANRYLGVFRFQDGKIVYWREFLNPQWIAEALGESNSG